MSWKAKFAQQASKVYLHVHVENEKSMPFYSHLGFDKGEMIEDYYTSLENSNAYISAKNLLIKDFIPFLILYFPRLQIIYILTINEYANHHYL